MATSNSSTQKVSEKSKGSEYKKVIRDQSLSKRRVTISRIKRKLLKHVWLVRLGILLAVFSGIFLLFLPIVFVLGKTKVGYYLSLASDFVLTPSGKINAIDNRTNILILGKGGDDHKAPDLTDTIIFVSIEHPTEGFRGVDKDSSVTLISLPRDIWIPELRAKLNSTYYWGNQKEPPAQRVSGPAGAGGGLILAKSSVEKMVGVPVQYGVVVDFSGFKKVIDVLGGIEIDVERTFVDEKYPIPGRENDECGGDPEYKCRYETIRFGKGSQLMDGETALKFVRSRNAEGDEGTDFARSVRQQKTIEAIKEGVLSRDILFSPRKLLELREVLIEYTETDIDASAAVIFARRLLQSREDVNSHVLPEDLLVNPPKSPKYDNLYVFIPKEDPADSSGQAWDQVHEWVECVLEQVDCN